MTKYYVYNVTFETNKNELQKEALEILGSFLPGQIIINTSMPTSALFFTGGAIGTELEVESTTKFSKTVLNVAITLTNENIGTDTILSIEYAGENIIDDSDESYIYTDLINM